MTYLGGGDLSATHPGRSVPRKVLQLSIE